MTHGALSSKIVAEHENSELFNQLLNTLLTEHGPQTMTENQLVQRLALLFWREIRLATAEAFETKANYEYEVGQGASDTFIFGDQKARLPKHYRAIARILPIETQLLIGRYQTMLSNQIAQTLSQLHEEQDRRMAELKKVNSNGI